MIGGAGGAPLGGGGTGGVPLGGGANDGVASDSGCGCEAVGSTDATAWWWLPALALVMRRPRQRREHPSSSRASR
jgi:MYXO-CTERM domain-containing protein